MPLVAYRMGGLYVRHAAAILTMHEIELGPFRN
jgi:hypothetical protein